MDYSNEFDDDLFVFPRYGKSILRESPVSEELPPRDDVREWNGAIDQEEFDRAISIPEDLDPSLRDELVSIIHDNWDCFYAEGVNRPIRGFQFHIDTGAAQPVACKPPHYGIHEGKIMQESIKDLIHNGWIRECSGPWLSKAVLAPKPHQEHVTDIADFVWRFCVNYRPLNAVTKPYDYPIPRCDDALEDFGDSKGRLYFISVDAKTGYHQISVDEGSQEKLAFMGPDNKKYCYLVMPFGPKNAPAVYTAMIIILKQEYDALFKERYPSKVDSVGNKNIMDDALIWSTEAMVCLFYFRCLCEIYKKYRLSFNPKKCDFFKLRFEWLGHDVTTNGNSPAKSKFDLIKDWPLPATGLSLSSFLGLVTFYNRYIADYESRSRPLRELSKRFYRAPIPPTVWSKELREFFESLKEAVTSDPCLARFDSSLPTFLKTDWSSTGMSYVLMQPADDPASKIALSILEAGGPNTFDELMSGARLRPVRFGSRRCSDREHHFHSFVGEAVAGRWAIGQCRRYLWGGHFYWLCDCNSLKELLDYTGDIHQICRIAQELLGYFFTFVHRPARMMRDVDGLNRFYDPLVRLYEERKEYDRQWDSSVRPGAYDPEAFPSHAIKCPDEFPQPSEIEQTLQSSTFVGSTQVPPASLAVPEVTGWFSGMNYPIRVMRFEPDLRVAVKVLRSASAEIADQCGRPPGWISLGSRFGSLAYAFMELNPTMSLLPCLIVEEEYEYKMICETALPTAFIVKVSSHDFLTMLLGLSSERTNQPKIVPSANWNTIREFVTATHGVTGTDLHAPAFSCVTAATDWLIRALEIVGALTKLSPLRCFLITVPIEAGNNNMGDRMSAVMLAQTNGIDEWKLQCGSSSSAFFGDRVHAQRWIAFGVRNRWRGYRPTFPSTADEPSPFAHCIETSMNRRSECSFPVAMDQNMWNGPWSQSSVVEVDFDYFLPQVLFTVARTKCTFARTRNAAESVITVYNSDYPAPTPSRNHGGTAFQQSFGVLFTDVMGASHVRPATETEVLRTYSFPSRIIAQLSKGQLLTAAVEAVSSGLPFRLASMFARQILDCGAFPLPNDGVKNSEHTVNCFVYCPKPFPTAVAWELAYNKDPETKLIWSRVRNASKPHVWTKKDLSEVNAQFRDYLRLNAVAVSNGRLVVYTTLESDSHRLMLIVVPADLRRDIFAAYHAAPSAGHMGPYKTLHRIRLWFFWPKVRSDVFEWCQQCAHCIATSSSIRRHSELMFSWPISIPFFILHLDLWQPGKTEEVFSGSTHLLAAMCDLTGFVICHQVKDATAAGLGRIFMEEVLLKVGLCGLVVVDAASAFLSVFEDMCEILGLRFHPAARSNHKAVSVERFFRFLNKAVTIAASDRDTNQVFIETSHCAAYAWNSSCIDGTDISRSVVAVGREFKFPLDIALHDAPTPVDGSVFAVHAFLRLGQENSQFAQKILQLLTEERRTYHRERANETRNQQLFQLGDLVMVRVAVQSQAAKNRVAKLTYRLRGPYEVVDVLERGAYNLQKFGKPDGPKVKHHAENISMLPPAIRPVEPLDGPDLRYLNNAHAPIPHPLKKAFDIKLYNEVWFSQPLNASPPKLLRALDDDNLQDQVVPSLLNSATVTRMPGLMRVPTVTSDFDFETPHRRPLELWQAIMDSEDKLFFVSFRPEGTLRARWFLVGVDLEQTTLTAEQHGNPRESGVYYAHFYARHPADHNETDPNARWWPEWRGYTTGSDGIIDYGARVMFPPTQTPNADKYIAWADVVNLSDPVVALLGPFDFQEPMLNQNGRSPSYRQVVPSKCWAALAELCLLQAILPPMLTELTRSAKKRAKRKRKKTS